MTTRPVTTAQAHRCVPTRMPRATDLAEHAIQGNEVLAQQDLAVLQRSAENTSDDASDVQQSAWTGFANGMQECLSD